MAPYAEDKAERQRRLDRTVRERLRRAWSTGRRRAPRVRRRRQRATASRPLAGPRPARTLTNSPRDTSSCTSDGPLISCRNRAPAAVTVAREPTAASSQPKGCAPTPTPTVSAPTRACHAATNRCIIRLASTSGLGAHERNQVVLGAAEAKLLRHLPPDERETPATLRGRGRRST